MKSEESDGSPPDVHSSNETTTDKGAAAVKRPMGKQKYDGPAKGNPSAKPTTGTQAKAKVVTTGSRQPISGRPPSSQTTRVAGAVIKKSNDQEQKASSSKIAPRSGMSSHAKIMEKKMAARNKAVMESTTSPSSAGVGGNQPNHVEKGGSIKALPTSKAVPKVKTSLQHCSTSAASKKPAGVTTDKLPVEKPVKLLHSTVSRPNRTPALSRPSANTMRKQPMAKQPGECSAPAPTTKAGVQPAGAKPEKLPPASRKELTRISSQPKKMPSLEVSKTSNIAMPTKAKLAKPTEAPATEAKHSDARLKVKIPTKLGHRVQPGASVSKGSMGTALQLAKTSKAVEKRSLSNRRSSSPRKSLSENNVGKQRSSESRPECEAEMKTKEAAPTLPVPSIVAQDSQSSLAITFVPSLQEVKETPCLSQANEPSLVEKKVANDELEANACMGPLKEMEEVMQLGPESPGQLKAVEINFDQKFEPALCLNDKDKIESIEAFVGSEHGAAEVSRAVNLNNTEVQLINIENVTDGEMNINNGELEVRVLPSEEICEKDSILPYFEGIPSVVDLGALNLPSEKMPSIKDNVVLAPTLDQEDPKLPALGSSFEDKSSPKSTKGELEECELPSEEICEKDSILPCFEGIPSIVDLGALNPPSENMSSFKDNVVFAPILDQEDRKQPDSGSSFEDQSSPEYNSNVSNAKKVKLSVYEYSEEADTEESPPDELYPEPLASRNQDVALKPCNLLMESSVEPSPLQHPVESENLPSEGKLGTSPEDQIEDQGVSKSSTLSGPDLAGKSSSITSTPEELKDYNSSSGVESKSERLESADNCLPQRDELCRLDLVEQDLGIHLEKGDYEPETLPADYLLEGSSTEPLVSSDEDHSESESVAGKTNTQGLEGIDNPVFEDKAANEPILEVHSLPIGAPHFKPSALHAVDEIEELATNTPCSPGPEPLDCSDPLSLQNCLLSKTELQPCFSDNQLASPPTVTDSQSHGPEETPSLQNSHSFETACPTDICPEVTLTLESVHEVVEDHSSELGETLPSQMEVLVADHPIDCPEDVTKLGEGAPSSHVEVLVADRPIDGLGDLAKLQELDDAPDDSDGDCMQQQCYPLFEKNDSILTGMNEGDKTLQTHCVPWITPLLPPILSTIYEVESAECEETRLEDDCDSEELQKRDLPCFELLEDSNDRVLSLQIEPVEVVQQLINHTLLLSGDGVKLQSKVMVDKAELSKWTDLISPLDDSTASITSVTSFSPEDLSSSQGEWTVVELETHH
ncbi:BTB/POZ domain-containing protein 8-like [Mobula hypostoma]|uniref:BTB/POZ domain-containing protein 8-like n=1 Tax=Mobula hypostoma TaxID=723540 RepID=UPI002FC31F47